MSEGPIKQWRDAHKPPKPVAIGERLHAHAADSPNRAYCGTADKPVFATHMTAVTCPNCQAAIRADDEAR